MGDTGGRDGKRPRLELVRMNWTLAASPPADTETRIVWRAGGWDRGYYKDGCWWSVADYIMRGVTHYLTVEAPEAEKKDGVQMPFRMY
jgi:hypothetical protein